MMQKIENGNPVFHINKCPEERKGKEMTSDELHDFAVEVLMKEYTQAGAKVIKYNKKGANEADFSLSPSGKTSQFIGGDADDVINVLVVYREEPTIDTPDIDTSWLIEEYKRTGAIPRITMASSYCISNQSKHGSPKICGGEFCFKYYSVSPMPDETNDPLDEQLSAVKLASKYAETWNQLDSSIVSPYLDKDFHYGSNWVFDELPSRKEYLRYFEGKLSTLRRTQSQIKAEIGRDHKTGEVAVILQQNGNMMALELETHKGRIMSAYMNDYDKKYKKYDPKFEVYQDHGDHIGCIMPAYELIQERLQNILEKSKAWIACDTKVTTDEKDFSSSDNLMPILENLPQLKIYEGYELDAFQKGDDTGWIFEPYCCKKGANIHYIPSEHGNYDDSLRIHGRIGWNDANSVPPALNYFDIPFTESGILQAWLLNNLTDFMPKGWHSNYSVRYYIFAPEELDNLFSENIENANSFSGNLKCHRLKVRDKVLSLDIDSLLPSVTKNCVKATIEYTYWNDWEGLVKVREKVYKYGDSVIFAAQEYDTLVEYSCRIMF